MIVEYQLKFTLFYSHFSNIIVLGVSLYRIYTHSTFKGHMKSSLHDCDLNMIIHYTYAFLADFWLYVFILPCFYDNDELKDGREVRTSSSEQSV